MTDRVIFVCTLILAGAYFYATEQLPSLEIGDPLGPKAFPRLLGVGLVITAVVLLFEMLRARRQAPAAPAEPKDPLDRGAQLVVTAAAVWTFLYFLVFEPLGYVLSTTIYLFVLMAYFNRGKWTANVLTAVLFSAGSYLMFTKLLGVNLAPGILPF
ncbi:MAG: tctB6 [Betaproteobacteria bacterium]|nr:tctB6 [Betaproteobacteria bacterium]